MKTQNIASVLFLTLTMQSIAHADELSDARKSWEAGDVPTTVIYLKSYIQDQPRDTEARGFLAEIYILHGQWLNAVKEINKIKEVRKLNKKETLWLAKSYLKTDQVELVRNIPSYSSINEADIDWIKVKVEIEFLNKNINAAEKLISHLEQTSELNSVNLLRAKLNMLKQHNEQARAMLDQILSTNPDDSEALSLRGVLYSTEKQHEQAITAYRKLEKNRGFLEYQELSRLIEGLMHLNKTDKALKRIKQFEKLTPSSSVAEFYRGIIAFKQQQYIDAKNHFDKAISQTRNFKIAMYYQALVEVELKNYNYAQNLVERLIQLNPADHNSLILKAKIAIKRGDDTQAIAILERLTDIETTNAEAVMTLIPLYIKNSQFEELAFLIKKHNSQEKRFAETAVLQLISQGKPELANQIINSIENNRDKLMLQAIVSDTQGNPKEALNFLLKYEPASNEDQAFNMLLARIYQKNQRYSESVEKYKKVLKNNPEELLALQGLAETYTIQHKYPEAIEQLTIINKLYPDRSDGLINIIKIYRASDAKEQAINTINQHWSQAPPEAKIFFAQHMAKIEKWEAAEKMFTTLLQEQPASEKVAIGYAGITQRVKDTDKAIEFIENWIHNSKTQAPIATTYLAGLYKSLKQNTKATELLVNLSKTYADNPIVLNNIAWYMKEDSPEEALKYAETAHNLFPSSENIENTISVIKELIDKKKSMQN